MTATSSTASAGPTTGSAAIDDAVTQLEQAATLRPNDPEINDHLGDAYWKVGRTARGALPVERRLVARHRGQRQKARRAEAEGRARRRAARRRLGADRCRASSGPPPAAAGQLSLDGGPPSSKRRRPSSILRCTSPAAAPMAIIRSKCSSPSPKSATSSRRCRRSKDSLTITGPFATALGSSRGQSGAARACGVPRTAGPTRCPTASALRLTKNLPVAAGLGGGSADAAAALRLLAAMSGRAIPFADLLEIAVQLGADVPMCLYSRPALKCAASARSCCR